MTVSYSFYLRFWAINSCLAVATGFTLGYIALLIISRIFSPSSRIFCIFSLISFPILAFFLYQIFIYKYFWGEYRGHFEYAYRERQIYKDANEIIRKHLDTVTLITVSLDELSVIGSERDDVYEKLLRKKEIDSNKELRFLILMKYANSLKKGGDDEKENRCLKQAAAIKPGNLVVNYRLANSFEKIGNDNEAVKSYNAALGDPNIWSDNLKNYVTNQIERVKTEGPAKKPPIPGLKYMMY